MKPNPLVRSLVHRVTDRLSPASENADSSKAEHRPLVIETLEPRILFSGSPAPAPEPAPAVQEDAAAQEAPAPAEAAPQTAPDVAEATPVAALPEAPAEAAAPDTTVPASEVEAADQAVTSVALTETELDAIAQAAAQRWMDSGLTAEQTDALANINYQIADLGIGRLGVAEGSTITIDDDAAGSGSWFIDTTPDQDEEFQSLDSGSLGALTGSEAQGRYDLLTVLIHEQGHVLGLEDSTNGGGDIMSGIIGQSQRRVVADAQAEGAIPGSIEGVRYAVDIVATKTDTPVNDPVLPGDNIEYEVTIANNGTTDATGVLFSDTLDANTTLVGGSVKVTPLLFDDSYDAETIAGATIADPNLGILANDVDPDDAALLTNGQVVVGSITRTGGTTTGTLSVNANGTFTYTSAVGASAGQSETFTYNITDGDGLAANETGTVTINIVAPAGPPTWFVNSATGSDITGDGTIANPFATLAPLDTGGAFDGADGAGDIIFVYDGTYASGITLEDGQQLLGERWGLASAGIAPDALATPTIDGGVTLAQNNTIRGLDIQATGAGSGTVGLAGTNFGDLTISDVGVISNSAVAVDLDTGTSSLGISLNHVTTNFGNGGIILDSVDNATVTLAEVNINNIVQGTADTFNSVTGRPTSIGNGDAIQIIGSFNTSGGFTINSGQLGVAGAIADNALDIRNSSNVALNNVAIENTLQSAIQWYQGNNLALDTVTFTNIGNNVAQNTGGVNIHDSGIRAYDVGGDLTILDSTFNQFPGFIFGNSVNGSEDRHVEVDNDTGTDLDVTVTGSSFSGSDFQALNLRHIGGSMDVVIGGPTAAEANTFSNINGAAISTGPSVESSTGNLHGLRVENNTFTNVGIGIETFSARGTAVGGVEGTHVFIVDNTINGTASDAIRLNAFGSGTMGNDAIFRASVTGNTINGVADQLDGIGGGSAFFVAAEDGADSDVTIDGNTAQGGTSAPSNFAGAITTQNQRGGDLDLVLTNNGFSNFTTGAANGFAVGFFGSDLVPTTPQTQTAVRFGGNNWNNEIGGFSETVMFDVDGFALMDVEGYAGAPTDGAALRAYLDTVDSNVGGGFFTINSGNVTGGAASVTAPTALPVTPLLADGAPDDVVIGDGTLSQGDLDATVAEAKARWTATGLTADQSAALDASTFTVSTLPGWYLGSSDGQGNITIDADAGGWGWYIDPTPGDDTDDAIGDKMDLLTTVLHEMGHVLGVEHSEDPDDVMAATLAAGVRRLPTNGQAEGAIPGSHGETEYIGAPINIGTLEAGKSVTITFDATVNGGVSAGTIISNQGTVSGSNFTDVLTDDPDQGGATDPTTTTVGSPLDAVDDFGITSAPLQGFMSSVGALPVSNADLLEGLVGAVSGTALGGQEGTSSNPAMLTNGQFGTGGNPLDLTETVSISTNTTLTYTLDTVTNPQGYNITGIDVFSGWRDSGRDRQDYTVRYATVDDPGNFIDLETVSGFNPSPNPSGQSSITPTTAGTALALNVGEIQFFFPGQENGYVGYRELDVFGAPAGFPTDEDTPLNVSATDGVLANDSPNPGAVIIASDSTSAQGAAVAVAADGSFTYNPTGSAALQALDEGDMTTDTFTYTITDATTPSDGLFNVSAFDVSETAPNTGSDTTLSDANETLGVWTALDALAPADGAVPAIVNANAKTYYVGAFASDTESVINYGPGGGDFGSNLAHSSIGSGTVPYSGDGSVRDMSVKAQTYLLFNNAGTYSIAAASDDGRRLELNGAGTTTFGNFTAHGGQIDSSSGSGTNFLQRNGTTGHNRSVGVFTVAAGDILALDSFFYERATGGGSFEISIKEGSDTGFGGTGDGWQLLQDGVAGITMSSTLAPLQALNTDTGTVTVQVTGVNDAPVANGDTNSVTETANGNLNPSASGSVLSNDSDVDDPNSSFTVTEVMGVAGPAIFEPTTYGFITLGTSGAYTYVLDDANSTVQALLPGQTLTDTISYQMSDNHSGGNVKTATANLVVTINGANDRPVANDDPTTTPGVYQVNEGGPALVIDAVDGVLANDTDVDNSTLGVSMIDQTLTEGIVTADLTAEILPIGLTGSFYDFNGPNPNSIGDNETGNQTALLLPLSEEGDFVLQRLGLTPSATVITPRVDFGTGTIVTQGDGSVLDRGGYSSGSVPPWQGLFDDVGETADMDGDQIAAVWSGKIEITTAGSYTFTTRSDDGTVLYINGNQVVDNNNFQGMTNRSGTVTLAAGLHDITIGGYEGGGGAGMQASYEGPDTTGRVIIPPSVLYNDVATPGTFVGGGLKGEYYDTNNAGTNGLTFGFNLDEFMFFQTTPDMDLAIEALYPSATDVVVPRVDFGNDTRTVPGDGSNPERGAIQGNIYGGIGVTLDQDQVGGVFKGTLIVPETADYRFWQRVDDGGTILIDVDGNGSVHDAGDFSIGQGNADGTVTLSAGAHDIVIASREGGGNHRMVVSWQQLNGTSPFAREVIGPDNLALDDATTVGDGSFTYDPNGQFEYLAAGETATDTFEYTVTDALGATDTATATITINGANDDAILTVAADQTVDEGTALAITDIASFTDVDLSDNHTVTIDWGDLTADTIFNDGDLDVDATGAPPATPDQKSVDATHTYAEEGTYTVTVTVYDGTSDVSDTFLVTVNNVGAQVAATATPTSVDEPGTGANVVTVNGTITDPGVDDTFTLTLEWDNQNRTEGAPQTFALGTTALTKGADGIDWDPVARTFSVDHSYADDNPAGTSADDYDIKVKVRDDDATAISINFANDQNGTVYNVSGTTGVQSAGSWNNVLSNGSGDGTVLAGGLVNSDNLTVQTEVNWLSNNRWSNGSWPNDGAAGSLYRAYLDTNTGGFANGTSIALSDLPADYDEGYSAYIYFDGGATGRFGTYEVNDGSKVESQTGNDNADGGGTFVFDNGTNTDSGNYLEFNDFGTNSVTLRSGTNGAGFRAPVNGIQIVAEDTEILTVTVNNLNPTANDDTEATTENASTVTNVTGNDTDPAGPTADPLTVASATITATTGLSGSPAAAGNVTSGGTNVNFDPGTDFDELDDGDIATVSIDYTLDDTDLGTDTGELVITITGENDAPILGAGTADMGNVSVSDFTNDGDSVLDLLNGAATDVDLSSLPTGIAINQTVVDAPGGGKFQFSQDGGLNWTDVGTVSDTMSLLLLETDRVRFVPDGVNQTGGNIRFRAWDQFGTSFGQEGTKQNTTTNGGTAPYSSAQATSSVSVFNVVIDGDEIIYTAENDGDDNDIRVSMVGGEIQITDANGHFVTTGVVPDGDPSGSGIRIAYGGQDLTIETMNEDDFIRFADMTAFTGTIRADGGEGFDQIETDDTSLTLDADEIIDFDAEQVTLTLSDITTSGTGTIDIDGTGSGAGTFAGVKLKGTSLATGGGDVSLTGEGGDTGTYARGVLLDIDFTTATRSSVDAGAGRVDITGTGGGSGLFGTGVLVNSADVSGDGVTILGSGGTGTMFNEGVSIQKGSAIDSGSGDLVIDGTGGPDGTMNRGVSIGATTLDTDGGSIDIDGTGGGSASGMYGIGVDLVAVTATATGTGTITLTGTGGSGNLGNIGVKLAGASSLSTGGNVTLTGESNGTGLLNHGVQVAAGSSIDVTGTAAVTIEGTSGSGSTLNRGIEFSGGSGASVVDGDLTLRGTSRGTLSINQGVSLATTEIGSTGSGNILVEGTGGATATGTTNIGVGLVGTDITTTGTGTITLTGEAGTGSSINKGVKIAAASEVSTASGAVAIAGTGRGSASLNDGVSVEAYSKVTAGGAGTLTITGQGSAAGIALNNGLFIASGSEVKVATGAMTLSGTGGGKASGASVLNNGIYILVGKVLSTAGGKITMTGDGGNGTTLNQGVRILSSTIGGTAGELDITGAGSSTTTGLLNTGVYMLNANLTGVTGGTITGTGGGGTMLNHGVYMQGIGGFANEGAYLPGTITGTAGGGATSKDKDGSFFPTLLPLLMAEADRRARRMDDEDLAAGYRDALRGLFARIRDLGRRREAGAGETPIYRSLDGHVGLEPLMVRSEDIDDALAATGLQSPETPADTRRTLLLAGQDHEPVSGVFAFADKNGELVSSAPLTFGGSITTREFLTDLEERTSEQSIWSPGHASGRATHLSTLRGTSIELTEAFGLQD